MLTKPPKLCFFSYFFGLFTILATPLAWAQSENAAFNPVLDDTFTIRLGASFEQVDTQAAKFDPAQGVGADIDLEQLGLDDNDVSLFLNARWRFSERWHLGLSYYGTDRSGSRTVDREIRFGELVVPIDGVVNTSFSADIYVLDLGYSFFKTSRAEFGARFGVHLADLDVALSGRGNIGQSDVNLGTASADTLAPLPNIGLFGLYALTPKLAVSGMLGYFSLDYQEYDGEVTVASAALDYRLTDTFGLGLGYSLLDFNLDVDEDIFDEHYEFEFNGPVVYLSAGF